MEKFDPQWAGAGRKKKEDRECYNPLDECVRWAYKRQRWGFSVRMYAEVEGIGNRLQQLHGQV